MKKTALLFLVLILLISPVIASGARPEELPVPSDMGDDFSRYDGFRIGVLTGSVQERYVMEKLPGCSIGYYDNYGNVAAAIRSGKMDATVMPFFTLAEFFKENPDFTYDPQQLSADDVCFAFSRTEQGQLLKEQFNSYLTKIREDGSLQEIINIWFGFDDSLKVSKDLSELKDINGTVRYGTNSEFYPICFMENGLYAGLDTAILYGFFEEYGYACHLEDVAFPSILLGVSTGVYDMGGGGIAYSEERAKSCDFSDTYASSPQVIVSPIEEGKTAKNDFTESFRRTFLEEDRWKLIVSGLKVTLIITLASFFFGAVLGIPVCGMLFSRKRLVKGIAHWYIKIMQGIPMVVILMILYYLVFSNTQNAIVIAIVGFSLFAGANLGEAYWVSIRGVDKGQTEAGIAIGLTHRQTLFHIILPQTMRGLIPGFRTSLISLLLGTAVVGYIAILDLTKIGDIIRSRTFEAFFPLLATAAIYFLISCAIAFVFEKIAERFEPEHRRRRIRWLKEAKK